MDTMFPILTAPSVSFYKDYRMLYEHLAMMKILVILFFVITLYEATAEEEFKLSGLFFGCERDLTFEYHRSLQDFSTKLYKQVSKDNNEHFVMSQYSVWLALSGIAEGSSENQKLLKILNLPQDKCFREKYYEIATSLESAGLSSNGSDVTITRRRILVIDNETTVNKTWASSVRASGLIETQTVALKNVTAIDTLKDIIKGKLTDLNLNGNSIILDSLDYEALWTTAFSNATGEKADFFDDSGTKIGTVEMMKIKKRVKLAHLPLLNAKLLELPVGTNGRYRMLFIVNLGKNLIRRTVEHFPSSFIVDSMPLLIESVIPLEVAIPKFKITSELDLGKALKNIGLDHIWMDANSSKYISSPPPLLSTLVQRVTVALERDGLSPPPASYLPALSDLATGLAGAVGRGFMANRPFLYGLVDSQTRTWLFAGAFSNPNQT